MKTRGLSTYVICIISYIIYATTSLFAGNDEHAKMVSGNNDKILYIVFIFSAFTTMTLFIDIIKYKSDNNFESFWLFVLSFGTVIFCLTPIVLNVVTFP
jgi:magnesium-transporting ATPase (P-type)